MVSVSQAVRSIIKEKPLIYDGLLEGIISHAALAEYLLPEIEKETGKKVALPAIVMAIRRYSTSISETEGIKKKDFKFNSEIIMKTGLADLTIVKSPSSIEKLKKIYLLADYDKGDTINIIHGNYEITIVISEKHLEKVKNILKDEKILNIENNLVSLSVSFSRDFLYTPGILAKVTRRLALENINVYESISTMTELIYIISKRDSIKAYKAMQSLVESSNHS